MTWRLTALYLATVDGHEHGLAGTARPAVRSGIAERTPKRRASYEAALTDTTIVRPAAADDDRLAAQLGPVALLDRGEERVEVDVQDGRRGGATHGAIIAPAWRAGQPLGSTATVTSGVRPA